MLECITHLDITDCNRITDFGLASISARCTRIQNLNMSGLTRLTERGAELIMREPINGDPRGQDLESLNLTFCQSLGDKAIASFAPGLGNLATINLTGCTKVSDEGIKTLTECCACIQNLIISHCTDSLFFASKCSGNKPCAESHSSLTPEFVIPIANNAPAFTLSSFVYKYLSRAVKPSSGFHSNTMPMEAVALILPCSLFLWTQPLSSGVTNLSFP